MINLVSLLVAAALISLQCGFEANAQIDSPKHLDNQLQVNVVPSKRRPPKFVSIQQPPPPTARLEPGSRLELACEIMGVPSPSVQWLKNGEPLNDFIDESNEIQTTYPTSLAWVMSTLVVSAAANGDVFTCVASNELASESASTTIETYETEDPEELLTLQKLFSIPSKPVISLYFIQVFQDIGTNAILPCRVTSSSAPQVYWQDKHDNVIYGNSRMRVLPSGDLMITGIRFSDMGEYTCTAKNMYGKDQIKSFLYATRPKH